jgi:hypothetical protein
MPRSNDAVAEMLQEFADLLAISGGDAFKVRAYEKAARAVAGYHDDVAGLDEKGLDAIPSVGSHLAHKIIEYRETGSVEELDELRARAPGGLRALLGVPGLGPRRARQVHDELGITSVNELLDALHGHRLEHLRGWGARSEENLAHALEEARAGGTRVQLAVALALAEELVAALAALPAARNAAYAGSLRRMRDTVGDIDLLVASDDPGTVVGAYGQPAPWRRRRSSACLRPSAAVGHCVMTVLGEPENREGPRRRRSASRTRRPGSETPVWACTPACLCNLSRRSMRRVLAESGDPDVLGFRPLAALSDVELDALTLAQGLVTVAQDVGEMDEHIVAVLTGDEAKALLSVEEFDGACRRPSAAGRRGRPGGCPPPPFPRRTAHAAWSRNSSGPSPRSFGPRRMTVGAGDDPDVLGFLSFATPGDVELDALTLAQGLVTLALDVGEMDEHIVALLRGDEAKALFGVEGLDSTCRQLDTLTTSGKSG